MIPFNIVVPDTCNDDIHVVAPLNLVDDNTSNDEFKFVVPDEDIRLMCRYMHTTPHHVYIFTFAPHTLSQTQTHIRSALRH